MRKLIAILAAVALLAPVAGFQSFTGRGAQGVVGNAALVVGNAAFLADWGVATAVLDAHRLGHRVKDRLLTAFPAIRDVLVHLEPHAYDKPNPD